jgi:hypothetical protein
MLIREREAATKRMPFAAARLMPQEQNDKYNYSIVQHME